VSDDVCVDAVRLRQPLTTTTGSLAEASSWTSSVS
jgi:hypothetical protein